MEAVGARQSMAEERPLPGRVVLVLRAATAGLVVLAAILAAVGVLYLIRSAGTLAAGPRVPGALPLQQLAGGESQPLLRMTIAWVPAGFVAGFAATQLTSLRPLARIALLGVTVAILLLLAGAVADAIAISDPLGPHLLPQVGRVGTWTAVALFELGSLLGERELKHT